MIINLQNLKVIFQGFSAAFAKGLGSAPSHYKDVAMVVPSTARENIYPWLGQFPSIREWIGDRQIQGLAAKSLTVVNRDFESTIAVDRNAIEDDNYGVFGPLIAEMGRTAGEHPDEMVFSLLANGFTTPCYDSQYFFDVDHPVGTNGGDYPIRAVSNFGGGSGTPWFLLDTSRQIKPLLFQQRTPYDLVRRDQESNDNVFWRKEYIYGVNARVAAAFGLWQLAYASKQPLDAAGYDAARTAMRSQRGDSGRPLGVRPTHLVVPPALESAGRKLLENDSRTVETGGGGIAAVANEWKGTAELIVSEWLA